MLLIDALYINSGGGLRLLEYLVRSLQGGNVPFFLLADTRCKGKFDLLQNVEYLESTIFRRLWFYLRNRNEFTKVLCFGNVPPPIKLSVPVYTYFQNINLLYIEGCASRKRRYLAMIKRTYISSLKGHTEKWIVQTDNTKQALMYRFNEDDEKMFVIPFFDLEDNNIAENDSIRKDYVLIGDYNFGNRGHRELIEAWRLLYEKGYQLTLHITCNENNSWYQDMVKHYNLRKYGIVNHGIVPFKKVKYLYSLSKALVYPSRNESLGLGIIEAVHYGCDVISSDLPFTYAVCSPSEVFNSTSPQSIAEAVIRYEKGCSPKSCMVINNQIDTIISLLQ